LKLAAFTEHVIKNASSCCDICQGISLFHMILAYQYNVASPACSSCGVCILVTKYQYASIIWKRDSLDDASLSIIWKRDSLDDASLDDQIFK
jgi:MinD superfamily P-loop ATPase